MKPAGAWRYAMICGCRQVIARDPQRRRPPVPTEHAGQTAGRHRVRREDRVRPRWIDRVASCRRYLPVPISAKIARDAATGLQAVGSYTACHRTGAAFDNAEP